ncbi:NaeI family type II restriction endonuclease [Streptomyces anulatus]|uniref:NaeI family type II restriction endonuclease n=1 Tax=Streptomyces anulatus TaxID=1892 RepID=UPI00386EEA8B|nr:hypothetical protein OG536_38775 [Streptomyces anulatus]
MSGIVVLLRELVDESGIGLRGLTKKIRADYPQGSLPRGYETLSKRLRGIGLQNEPHLIHAIIATCTHGERREQVTAQVTELLADLRGATATATGKAAPRQQPAPTDRQLLDALIEINTLRKKLERARSRAERAESELAKAHELLAARDRQASRHPPLPRHTVGRPTAVAPPAKTAAHTASDSPRREVGPSAEEVISFLKQVPDLQRRTASSLRAAFNSVLDGERTGRYDLTTLGKVEKVYLGSRVEHFLWEAWGLTRDRPESPLREVPLRFTWTSTWVLGPEHVGRTCLLVRADELKSQWSMGVLDVTPEYLSRGSNRDGKSALSTTGRKAIHWMVKDAPLPKNMLLHLDQPTLARVFSPADDAAATHAQGRTDNLFRVVQGRLIDSTTVSTVAMTSDFPKRVRQARRNLLSEGILVLGHLKSQLQVAAALGLPQPDKGQWVSTRVVHRQPDDSDASYAKIDGEEWRVATPDDPVQLAPAIS